jgi:uncharacterized membrane protein YsdA (DUF1294 family)/cold shock CspA family protein
MRNVGRLTKWDDSRGFGFVTAHDGGEQAFVHIKAFSAGVSRRPVDGDLISYELASDKQGRLRAEKISFAGARPLPVPTIAASPNDSPVESVLMSLCCAAVLVASVLGFIAIPIVLLIAIASALAFIMYAFDKSAAIKNRNRSPENAQTVRSYERTPESTLHLLSLLGGWPGAFLAQRKWRHKSRKLGFRRVYWLTVGINLMVVAGISSEKFRASIHAIWSALK